MCENKRTAQRIEKKLVLNGLVRIPKVNEW